MTIWKIVSDLKFVVVNKQSALMLFTLKPVVGVIEKVREYRYEG